MALKEELNAMNKIDPTNMAGILNLTLFNKSSGPRLHITSTYFEQSVVLNESEVAMMYTGYEKEFGRFNDSLRIAKVPYTILARIEKYPTRPGFHYTLILKDNWSGFISLVENKHYESLAEEHGYTKSNVAVDMLPKGATIPKGQVLSKCNSHDTFNNYKSGFNANVCYISRNENIEDGYIISKSLADRISFTSITEVEVTLGFSDVLLNLYGDKDNYKSFPDMFEQVAGGIFCGKRSITSQKLACDGTVNALMTPNTHDDLFYGDGEVLDVDIHVNNYEELTKDNGNRKQIVKCFKLVRDYRQNVVDALFPHIRDRATKVTERAHSRYVSYKDYLDTCVVDGNGTRFDNGKGVFEFATIKFIIGRRVTIAEGTKISNRFGNKGVACSIMDDDLMPIDQWGTRAELIFNPIGVVGRSNPGQMYEHELNFIADRVVAKVRAETSLPVRYKILQDFFNRVDMDSANLFRKWYKKSVTSKRKRIIEDTIMRGGIKFNKTGLSTGIESHMYGIHVRQHPFKNLTLEELKQLYIYFDVKPGKIITGVVHPNGKTGYYKSINNVIIAKQYQMVLKHTTASKFSSGGIGAVNSLGLPHKCSLQSKNLPNRNTVIKFGEMETNVAINRVPPEIVNRHLAGCGSNLEHRDGVSKITLLNDPFMLHDVPIKSVDIRNSIGSDSTVALLRQMSLTVYQDTITDVVTIGLNPSKN